MLYQIMFSNNLTPQQAVTTFLVSIFVFFVSLAFHEYAHGFAAYKMGDLTPKLAGRLTLNPLKHLDMTGMLFFMFLGVGWAKPMPVNPLNFKKYKKGTRLVAIAGVLANFLLGLVAAIIFAIMTKCGATGEFASFIYLVLTYFIIVNSALAMFNFLPLAPLDGFRFIASFMKPNNKFIKFNERHGYSILLLLILGSIVIEFFTGFDLFNAYLNLLTNYVFAPITWLGGL